MIPFGAWYPAGYQERVLEHRTTRGRTLRFQYLRRSGVGPTVIVLHELPGVTSTTVALGDLLADRGYSVVMPILLDRPRLKASLVQQLKNTWKICMAREFAAFARRETGDIVEWLDALAEREFQETNEQGIGVVGMCFSGGFALALVRNERVSACVTSQPSLPFAFIPFRRGSLGVSADDMTAISSRARGGLCIRGLRYQRDPISPGVRLLKIGQLPNAEIVEVPTWKPWKHSVISNALEPNESDLGRVLEETLAYLDRQLATSDTPAMANPPINGG